jgi:cytoskeletal protein RodZ
MKQRQKKSRLLLSLSLSILLFFSLSINKLLRDTFQQTSPVVKHALEEIDAEVEYVDTRFCLVGLETLN